MRPHTSPGTRCKSRSGIACVELAILLPFLAFGFLVAVDFARIFYYSITIANCARNGALFGSDPSAAVTSPYQSIQQAALADAGSLSPSPTVSTATTTDASGNICVAVTVSYLFQTITNYPGIPSSINLQRTVKMRLAQTVPSFD